MYNKYKYRYSKKKKWVLQFKSALSDYFDEYGIDDLDKRSRYGLFLDVCMTYGIDCDDSHYEAFCDALDGYYYGLF